MKSFKTQFPIQWISIWYKIGQFAWTWINFQNKINSQFSEIFDSRYYSGHTIHCPQLHGLEHPTEIKTKRIHRRFDRPKVLCYQTRYLNTRLSVNNSDHIGRQTVCCFRSNPNRHGRTTDMVFGRSNNGRMSALDHDWHTEWLFLGGERRDLLCRVYLLDGGS